VVDVERWERLRVGKLKSHPIQHLSVYVVSSWVTCTGITSDAVEIVDDISAQLGVFAP
jgi:hypothetical protein